MRKLLSDCCQCWHCSLAKVCWPTNPSIGIACLKGNALAAEITGTVVFRDVPQGVEVCANVSGLPPYRSGQENIPPIGPHGFHIHEYGNCQVGDLTSPFMKSGGHWNPMNAPHGNHAGDFPALFSNHGKAQMCFFSDKFQVADIIGKAVVIHENPDDYRTQPAGNSGRRIACGIIEWSTC